MFVEIENREPGAFFRKSDCDCAPDAAVASGNERNLVLEFPAATMGWIVRLRTRAHLVFATRLLRLGLFRPLFLFLWHKSGIVRREGRSPFPSESLRSELLGKLRSRTFNSLPIAILSWN